MFIQTHKGKAEALCSCFRTISGRMYSIDRAPYLMRHLANAAASLVLKLQKHSHKFSKFCKCLHQLLKCYISVTILSCSETKTKCEASFCMLLQKIHSYRTFSTPNNGRCKVVEHNWDYFTSMHKGLELRQMTPKYIHFLRKLKKEVNVLELQSVE